MVIFWLFLAVAPSLGHSCNLVEYLTWYKIHFPCPFSADWFIVPCLLSTTRGAKTVVSTASQVLAPLVQVQSCLASPSCEHHPRILVADRGVMFFHECRRSHDSTVATHSWSTLLDPSLRSTCCFLGCNHSVLMLQGLQLLCLFWASFSCLLQAQWTRGIGNFLEPLLTLASTASAPVCWGSFGLLILSWLDVYTSDTCSLCWQGVLT